MEKVAFITGANRGLGLGTALELAKKGVHVIIGARDQKKCDDTLAIFSENHLKADAFIFDINQLDNHVKLYDYVEKQYGKLDILVNNAGIMLDKTNHASETSLEILRETFDTNFFNVIALTQTLLPLIKKSSAGRIVNLSSILASLTLHRDPHSSIYESKRFAYNASKTALNAFTVHLAHELKNTTIKVNSAHPGWVKTDMGGIDAPLALSEGIKTSVELALLEQDGPTGSFIHMGETLPW